MSTVRLDRISKTDAENFVVTLWRILEKYNVASPKVTVEPRYDGLVDMCFTFSAVEDAELVAQAWRQLADPVTAEEALKRMSTWSEADD